MRELVRDRERLAALSIGGSVGHPMPIPSASVVETRVRNLQCPQCNGSYKIEDHRSPASGIRQVNVRCQLCSVPRTLWLRIVSTDPN